MPEWNDGDTLAASATRLMPVYGIASPSNIILAHLAPEHIRNWNVPFARLDAMQLHAVRSLRTCVERVVCVVRIHNKGIREEIQEMFICDGMPLVINTLAFIR